MNTVSVIGNLVKDPVASVTQDGEDVCKFTIAVNRGRRDENGKDQADFVPIRATRQRAALCREYLRKGRKVGVTGKLRTYSFTDENGKFVNGFYVALDDLTFLYNGDPNKGDLGDVHSDDGVVHHSEPQDLNFTQVTQDDDLPF